MNTPSPLVPQGTSPDRGKSTLYFKILMIVSLHVVVIGGLLLQGCKDTKTTTTSGDTVSTDQTNTDLNALPPVNTNYAPAVGGPGASNLTAVPPPPPYVTPSNPAANISQPPPVAPPIASTTPEGHEYVITRGDTLAVIAKKNGVSLKALKEANPGVDPRKLKVGAKLQVPGGSETASAASATGGDIGGGDTTEYVVKSGDMLYRIAKSHGTTVAKIKALNGLKTSSIKVGQKLKLPGSTTTASAAPASAPAAPPMTAPASTPATPYASNATSPAGTK